MAAGLSFIKSLAFGALNKSLILQNYNKRKKKKKTSDRFASSEFQIPPGV